MADALGRTAHLSESHRAIRARALSNLGTIDFFKGDYRAALDHLEGALQLIEHTDDIVSGAEGTFAWASLYLGLTQLTQGDAAAARHHLARCVPVAREFAHAGPLVLALCMPGDATASDHPAEARAYYEESLLRSREAGLGSEQSFALTSLSRLALDEGDFVTARTLVEEGLALRRQEGAVHTTAMSLAALAEVLRCMGDGAGAAAAADESLRLGQEVGSWPTVAWALHNLGHVALSRGESTSAGAYFAQSIRLAQESGQEPRPAASLAGMASVAAQRGRYERAAHLLGAADALLAALGRRMDMADRPAYEATALAAHTSLDEQTVMEAMQAGQGLPREAAVAEALAEACA